MSRQSDSGFWTSCPACCHVHQYSREYLKRKLRCPVCRRPFVADELPSPPPVVPGTDMYYCSWGFFPLGFPQSPTPPSNWAPFTPCNSHPYSNVDPTPVNPAPVPAPVNPALQKTTARKKVLASKRTFSNGVGLRQDDEIFTGIDVNEVATVSDLMGGDTGGGNHSDAIGFNIDVDVDTAAGDVFGIW
ncbi:Chaperone DnaJ-domain superfamily protein [Rhynchospora pubera]|uniref:Chaperone DnaJ-domain superfamily protein n=1 Tax=Rhynchospora pubera TaxID=906938 RepID=A0AAV8G245_9POAL|nr:Chaperone DnaJ-domain superfamily protein [Rhynchospora pubera]